MRFHKDGWYRYARNNSYSVGENGKRRCRRKHRGMPVEGVKFILNYREDKMPEYVAPLSVMQLEIPPDIRLEGPSCMYAGTTCPQRIISPRQGLRVATLG